MILLMIARSIGRLHKYCRCIEVLYCRVLALGRPQFAFLPLQYVWVEASNGILS